MIGGGGGAPLPGRRCDVVIVGGGITGLAAAHHLEERRRAGEEIAFRLLEGSPRLGGPIRSDLDDGYLFEAGPDSLVTQKPAGLALCRRLGLEAELIQPAVSGGGIDILHRGRLVRLPDGFQMAAPSRLLPVLGSPLFSWRGKLRLLLEPLVPARPPAEDESLASFVIRRSGREVLERVAEPFVGGLYTADADRLSLAATAPRLLELERRTGSLTRAMTSARRQASSAVPGGPGPLVSLRRGMGAVIDRLIERLSGPGRDASGDLEPRAALEASARVASIRRDQVAGCWRLEVRRRGELQTIEAEALILTCPAFAGARLLRDADPGLAEQLGRLEYASCATLSLAYRRSDVSRPPASFGFFVPRTEARPILACSYASHKFAGRAPEDRMLVRLFFGGALHPEILEREDAALAELGHQALVPLLGLAGPPVQTRTYRHPRSMPQFPVGYPAHVARLREAAARHPGLLLAGSSLGAYGLPDCIASGEAAARAALELLAARERATPLSVAT